MAIQSKSAKNEDQMVVECGGETTGSAENNHATKDKKPAV